MIVTRNYANHCISNYYFVISSYFHHYLIISINLFSVFLLSFMKDTEWREYRDRFYIKDSNYARFLGQGEKLHQYLLHSRDAMVGRAMTYT